MPCKLQTSSPTIVGDLVLVGTSHGRDYLESQFNAEAPSFVALHKETGRIVWKDNSPGEFILHGQWSSPAYGVFNGVAQAIFAGGDGWLYSFDFEQIRNGRSRLLWKFDCNPKRSKWMPGGKGTRNNLIASPVIHQGRVYIGTGQNPEHGEGDGILWCIDPNRRGDISPELVVPGVLTDQKSQVGEPVINVGAARRVQAATERDQVVPNPNSGAIWKYVGVDRDGDGSIEFLEQIHRTISSVAIHNEFLFVSDLGGALHCLNPNTGDVYWTHDLFAASYSTPLIVGDFVYVGDEDGDIVVMALERQKKVVAEIPSPESITGPLISDGNSLFVPMKSHLSIVTRGRRISREEIHTAFQKTR